MSEPDDSEALAAENHRDALAAVLADAWHDLDNPTPAWNEHMVVSEVWPLLAEAVLVAGWQPPAALPSNAAEVMGYTDWEAEAHRNDPTEVTDEGAERAWYLAVSAGRPDPQPGDPIPDMMGGFHEHTWYCRMCGTPHE